MDNFGKWLRSERKRQGISQRELAARVYMRPCTICGYERGSFVPAIDRAEELARSLGYELQIVRAE